MGRRKTYDRDGVVERAMRLFWERGYHATSTRDLTEAMGVNPYSLYAEFGSKEALFSAVIKRYEDDVVEGHFGRLETADAGMKEIRDVMNYFGDSGTRAGAELGCLLCNASVERAPTVELSEASTARFVARMTGAFANALKNAADAGRLKDDVDTKALGRFFPTVLMGMFVLSRANVDGSVLRAAADEALAHLAAASR